MAVNPKGSPLVPSLLDRLLADRRGKRTLRDVRAFVAQDLEDLLNTRCRCELLPKGLPELATSMVNYGLPDFTGVKMTGTVDRDRLRKRLEDAIRRYESRLTSIRVTLIEEENPSDTRLHFRIYAKLLTQPAPEPVVFDSHMEPSTATIEVE